MVGGQEWMKCRSVERVAGGRVEERVRCGGGREGELECRGMDGVKRWELWRECLEWERVRGIEEWTCGVDLWSIRSGVEV